MPTPTPNKPSALTIKNAAADVPRMITGAGKACDGEWGLLMFPQQAVARLGWVPAGRGNRQVPGRVWSSTHGADVPLRPTEEMPQAEVKGGFAELHRRATEDVGEITLKGQWAGTLECGEDSKGLLPVVRFTRKVASYAVLTIESKNRPSPHWKWTLTRTATWFSKPDVKTGQATGFAAAIREAVQALSGVLGAACAIRDSRRRGALDETRRDSLKPAKDRKDKLPGWAEKAEKPERAAKAKAGQGTPTPPKRGKKAASPPAPAPGSGWLHVVHDDEVPDAAEVARGATKVVAAMDAGGFDRRADYFVGELTEEWEGWPAGSLLVMPPEDNAGFYLHPPVRPHRAPPAPAPADGPGLTGWEVPGEPGIIRIPLTDLAKPAANAAQLALRTQKEADAFTEKPTARRAISWGLSALQALKVPLGEQTSVRASASKTAGDLGSDALVHIRVTVPATLSSVRELDRIEQMMRRAAPKGLRVLEVEPFEADEGPPPAPTPAPPPLPAPASHSKPLNRYIAHHNGRSIEILAPTSYDAQMQAAEQLKVKPAHAHRIALQLVEVPDPAPTTPAPSPRPTPAPRPVSAPAGAADKDAIIAAAAQAAVQQSLLSIFG